MRSHPDVRVVALDEGDALQFVHAVVKGMGLTYTVWRDPDGSTQDLYNTTDLPCTYFIDRQGIVRDMNIGPMVDESTVDARAASIITSSVARR